MDNPDQIGGVGQITVMKPKIPGVNMGILIQVVNPARIETGTAFDSVDGISFSKQ